MPRRGVPAWKRSTPRTPAKPVPIRRVGSSTGTTGTGTGFSACSAGWDGDADVVAGMNLLARVDDPDIHLWTPKEQVKAILDERFRRRMETGNLVHAVNQGNGTPLPPGLQRHRAGEAI